ncbi:hypothetical protein L195_g061622, partial [Trifolium pratense]
MISSHLVVKKLSEGLNYVQRPGAKKRPKGTTRNNGSMPSWATDF